MTADEPTSARPWTIGRLLTWTTEFLGDKGTDSPRLDAEVLLAHARGCERIDLYAEFEQEADDSLRSAFRELVRRRAAGTPVAYLVGHREFFSLSFQVTPDVLIPRPETELLVVRALDVAKTISPSDALQIADVGTGSGILAICCAKHLPQCQVTAIDISPAALEIARANAVQHGVADRIELVKSNLFADCPSAVFDLIVSNPPYVATAEFANLDPGVRDHEPQAALDGGEQGTAVIERLVAQAGERIKSGGWLLVEVSPTNAERVQQLFAAAGQFTTGEIIADLAGLPRIVQVRLD